VAHWSASSSSRRNQVGHCRRHRIPKTSGFLHVLGSSPPYISSPKLPPSFFSPSCGTSGPRTELAVVETLNGRGAIQSTYFRHCEYCDELRVTISSPPKLSPSILLVCFAYPTSRPWFVPASLSYIGEFVFSFPFVWCKSREFWWPGSFVLGAPARFLATGHGHRRGLSQFQCLFFLSIPHLILTLHLQMDGWRRPIPFRLAVLLKSPYVFPN
jgi:hypothetical protein